MQRFYYHRWNSATNRTDLLQTAEEMTELQFLRVLDNWNRMGNREGTTIRYCYWYAPYAPAVKDNSQGPRACVNHLWESQGLIDKCFICGEERA